MGHEHMRSFSREEDILMFASIERNQTARGISWIKVAEEMGKTNERTPAMLRNRLFGGGASAARARTCRSHASQVSTWEWRLSLHPHKDWCKMAPRSTERVHTTRAGESCIGDSLLMHSEGRARVS